MKIGQDLRFAVRTLFGRDRATTLVCLLTLALGIGANSAIFTVIQSVLLNPLPYDRPERLFRFYETYGSGGEIKYAVVNGLNFIDYRDQVGSFEWLACANNYNPEGFNLVVDGHAVRIAQLKVTSGYFEALGVKPVLGRTFSRQEEIPDRPGAKDRDPNRWFSNNTPARPIAVISHALWSELLGKRQDVLGQTLRLDGVNYQIVGVMPSGFRDAIGDHIDVWVPLDMYPGGYNTPDNSYLTAIGKLKEGVSFEQAQSELNAVAERLRSLRENKRDQGAAIFPLLDETVGQASTMLYVLLAAVGLLLLAACVNVANLSLAKASARERELAVRTALGSTRGGLVRLLLTESFLLSLLGGLLGLAIAAVGVRALIYLRPSALPRLEEIAIDWRVLGFTASASLATGALFGLLPAFRSSRVDLEQVLRQEGRTLSGGVRKSLAGRVLVAAQVALALVLLVGGVLLAESFRSLLKIDLGFSGKETLTFRLDLPQDRYADPAKRVFFYQELRRRLEALPAVKAAGTVTKLPLAGPYHHWGFGIASRPKNEPGENPSAQFRCVDGHYFQAMGIQLKRGRLLTESDREDSVGVAVINEAAARRYWPDRDPLGDRINGNRTIVGIVSDVRYEYLSEPAPMVYFPHQQAASDRNWSMTEVVRAESPRAELFDLVRGELAAIDPGLAIYQARPMTELIDEGVSRHRFAAFLMGAFAAVGLLLAAVGIYGVLSFMVTRRTHEIGVRMAVGASGGRIQAMVVAQALTTACAGVTAGLAVAVVSTGWLSSMVHGVSATDPRVYGGAAIFLLITALAVAWLPARRASRLDPLSALRGAGAKLPPAR